MEQHSEVIEGSLETYSQDTYITKKEIDIFFKIGVWGEISIFGHLGHSISILQISKFQKGSLQSIIEPEPVHALLSEKHII